jgi:predicted MPP superfamily phosphohydrolase
MNGSETEQLYASLVAVPTSPRPASPRVGLPASQVPSVPAEPTRGPWLQLRVPHRCEWNRYSLTIPALPASLEGFRVVQITDLHFKKFWSPVYDHLIERINREAADLILITGDFVNNKRNHRPALPFVKRFVSQLQAKHGRFGIMGNHDRYRVAKDLGEPDVKLLDGLHHTLNIDGAELELLGLPGVNRCDLTDKVIASYPAKRVGVPRLVLAHFPDQIRNVVGLKPDIYFAGHTHGGQVCLPGGIPLITHDKLPGRLSKGVHRVANTWLVVSRGIGFTGVPFRLFCPAEIIEITLSRG